MIDLVYAENIYKNGVSGHDFFQFIELNSIDNLTLRYNQRS